MACIRFLWLWVYVLGCSGIKVDLVTFNTGLLPSNKIPYYQERKEAISSVIVNSSADVVCLQELWLLQDILDVAHAANNMFPYYHGYDAAGSPGDTVSPSSTVCDLAKFTELQGCLFLNCRNVLDQGLTAVTDCAFTKCNTVVNQLNQQCINCIVLDTTATNGTLEAFQLIQQSCVSDPAKNYATTHGLLLLSKYPLKNKKIHTYHPGVVVPITRGYIAAEIDGLGEVVCTHLTTEGVFTSYIGPPQFSSFEELQKDEVTQLLMKFPATQSGYPPIIMGDFNHGPRTATLVPELEANYQLIIDSGFKSPYVTEVGSCTFCADNPLANATGNISGDVLIDHIYVSSSVNKSAVSGVKRMWDSMTAISAVNTALNDSVIYRPLSDHFAVRLTYQAKFISGGSAVPFNLLVTVLMAVITLDWLL
jgi:endonuclease/exonuclease/phosphatase family metal-dependent hydrolase